MNGENKIPGLAEKIAEAQQEKAFVAQANSMPLPGPLADAFSLCPDIKVGTYTVRPFYDLDFEVLQMCDHPLIRMAMGGEQFGQNATDLRGKSAWVACWILTRSVDEVDETAQKGKEAVLQASRKEFSRKQLGELVELSKAVLTQFGGYFSTVVGLAAADSEDEAPKKA